MTDSVRWRLVIQESSVSRVDPTSVDICFMDGFHPIDYQSSVKTTLLDY